jgi:hypothetical protein
MKSGRRFARYGDRKEYCARHRTMSSKAADRLERGMEKATRQESRRDIEEQLADRESEEGK